MKTKQLSLYNIAVKMAYFKLLKQTKLLLATIESHELRYTLQREDHSELKQYIVVHEIVSPLLYLSLKVDDCKQLTIYWGIEIFDENNVYSAVTGKFVRLLYKLTSVEQTLLNIEQCISTRFVITNCSKLYEYVEDAKHKLYQFSLIKHKCPSNQQTKHLSIAS